MTLPTAVRIARFVTFDSETHVVEPMPLDPPAVCFQITTDLPLPPGVPCEVIFDAAGRKTAIYLARDAKAVFMHYLAQPNVHYIAHNAAFDVLVSALCCGVPLAEWARVYEEGCIHDTAVREQLIAIARGWTADKAEIDPRTGKRMSYSLAGCVAAHFGQDISDEKTDPQGWRMHFALLDGLELDQWPIEAKRYAAMDPFWTTALFESQAAEAALGGDAGVPLTAGPWHLATEPDQTRAALALAVLSAQMPKADPAAVEAFAKYHTDRTNKAVGVTAAAGLVRWNKARVKTDVPRKERTPATTCPNNRTSKECCGFAPCLGGWSVNTELLKDMMKADWGDAVPMTEGGADGSNPQVSTAKDYLMDARSRPLLRIHGMAAENRKMLDQYLPILRRATVERIRSWFKVLVNTNRTACGNPVNWQNPPKAGGFRECFVPDPGNVFASVDYSGIEAVTLAQLLIERYGSSLLADAINAGKDIHCVVAASIFGRTYEAVHAGWKAGDPVSKAQRQAAKALVFGVPGGMGAKRIVDTYGVQTFVDIADAWEWDNVLGTTPRDQATRDQRQALAELVAGRVRKAFIALEPRLKDYFDWVARQTYDGAVFTWIDPLTGFQRGRVGYSDGCNTQFQGRAAMGAKRAMWRIFLACYGLSGDPRDACMVGVRLWNFVHDEFLAEGPEATAHEWAHRISEIMIEAMVTVLPDMTVQAPPALMRRWAKAADTVYKDGRLVPWEPKAAKIEDDPMDLALEEHRVWLVGSSSSVSSALARFAATE